MRKIQLIIGVVISCWTTAIIAHALVDVPIVVVEAVQTSDMVSARHEYITLRNTSDRDIDMTNWSLRYGTTQILSFASSRPDIHLVLPAGAQETIFSSEYAAQYLIESEGYMTFQLDTTSGLYGPRGTVSLRDDVGTVIDQVSWGASSNSRTETSLKTTAGDVLRRMTPDDRGAFFEIIEQAEFLPVYGMLSDKPDVCRNIDGLQHTVPDNLVLIGAMCHAKFVPADVWLSEILPNPDGIDAGHEFVELYNNTDAPVDMTDYMLVLGEKQYPFPSGSIIQARAYGVWTDNMLGLTLPNTTGLELQLIARDSTVVDTMPAYRDAAIDQSWSRIDDTWQYTNRPTPNGDNLPMEQEMQTTDILAGLLPCEAGYYRYASTGRCRKIPAVATLAPCRDNQYRSEETGRCRSIAAIAAVELKPCGDDQFRNPATGRCKKIASSDDPAPCEPGKERNPATGRCRTIASSHVPAADFALEPLRQAESSFTGWWAVGGIASAAVGYGAWEWRTEMARMWRRIWRR